MKKVFQKSKIALLLGVFLIPVFIFSVIFVSQTKASKLVLLDQNQVVDKTYFAAGEVLDIRGTINGDAFLAGSNITFSGRVNGNLIVAGNSLNLKGEVNGMIISAGNTLTIDSSGVTGLITAGNLININSRVEKNAYVAGNSVNISSESNIGQDLFTSSNTLNLNAQVGRDFFAEGAVVSVNSNINRNASVLAESGYFGEKAKINGNFERLENMSISPNENSFVVGSVSYVKQQINHKSEFLSEFKSEVFGKLTVGLFATIIFGIILIKLFEKPILKMNKEIEVNSSKVLLKGLGFVLLVPLISVILLITIIGIKLAIILMSLYVLLIAVSVVIGSIFLGDMLLKFILKRKTHSTYLSLIVGSLVLILLAILPFIGWIISLFIMSVSIGVLMNFLGQVNALIKKAK